MVKWTYLVLITNFNSKCYFISFWNGSIFKDRGLETYLTLMSVPVSKTHNLSVKIILDTMLQNYYLSLIPGFGVTQSDVDAELWRQ